MAGVGEQLRSQWASPNDILSLLLLIGGDIVQKAIAELVGHGFRLPGTNRQLFVSPVAFSFGWVAYSFSNLIAAFGEMKLIPPTDCPSLLVSCCNGFVRENRSWALGRLLRDHELRNDVDSRDEEHGGRSESIRIDIFKLGPVATPSFDFVCGLGWVVVAVQILVSIVPWVVHGNWGISMVTFCGITLASMTCAMPQWIHEKWPAAKLRDHRVTCLTRGNGHLHIMVFIGSPGSWNLEQLATGRPAPFPETRWISLIVAVFWTFLLVTVSGIQSQTWYLVGIGGIGMLQNLFAAATPRDPAAANFHITSFSRAPTIIGRRVPNRDEMDGEVDLKEAENSLAALASWASSRSPQDDQVPQSLVSMSTEDGLPVWLEAVKPERVSRLAAPSTAPSTVLVAASCWFRRQGPVQEDVIYASGVHGALVELEKWVPTAGLAMVQVFFPQGLVYNDAAIRNNVHKKFWKRAYYTRETREKVEMRRRSRSVAASFNADGSPDI